MGSCLAERLGSLIDLSAGERAALETLEQRERTLRRGAVLLREHDKLVEMYVVKRGMLMSYLLLPDGSRQILRLLFPGDLVAMPALVYRQSPETIVALSESVLTCFERATVATIVTEQPRLMAVLMGLHQMERVAITDRLAGLGRTSAKARVAALLIEIRNRLRMNDPTIGATFAAGLTQEEIGDAVGLTAVHVNRMLRQLEEDGLLSREGGRVTFVDEEALMRAANYVDRYAGLDMSWLPDAR